MKERISNVPLNNAAASTNTTEPEVDINDIESMEAPALRQLVRRMACQCGLVARMTQEETAQAMLDVLAETALKPISSGLNMKADIQSRIVAIDKWLDRTRGKPIGSAPQINLGTSGDVQVKVVFVGSDNKKIDSTISSNKMIE